MGPGGRTPRAKVILHGYRRKRCGEAQDNTGSWGLQGLAHPLFVGLAALGLQFEAGIILRHNLPHFCADIHGLEKAHPAVCKGGGGDELSVNFCETPSAHASRKSELERQLGVHAAAVHTLQQARALGKAYHSSAPPTCPMALRNCFSVGSQLLFCKQVPRCPYVRGRMASCRTQHPLAPTNIPHLQRLGCCCHSPARVDTHAAGATQSFCRLCFHSPHGRRRRDRLCVHIYNTSNNGVVRAAASESGLRDRRCTWVDNHKAWGIAVMAPPTTRSHPVVFLMQRQHVGVAENLAGSVSNVLESEEIDHLEPTVKILL